MIASVDQRYSALGSLNDLMSETSALSEPGRSSAKHQFQDERKLRPLRWVRAWAPFSGEEAFAGCAAFPSTTQRGLSPEAKSQFRVDTIRSSRSAACNELGAAWKGFSGRSTPGTEMAARLSSLQQRRSPCRQRKPMSSGRNEHRPLTRVNQRKDDKVNAITS